MADTDVTELPEPAAAVATAPVARSVLGRPATFLLVATYLVAGLGYLMGFNQLATQSPVDAVLPVALFSVGVVGVLSMVRLSLFATSEAARAGRDLDRRQPLQIEVGFANLGFGAAALASMFWQWGVTAQAMVVGAYGLYFVQVTVFETLLIARRDPDAPDVVQLGASAAQAVLLVGFAWVALADAGIKPFG